MQNTTHITTHAINRYIDRVDSGVNPERARRALINRLRSAKRVDPRKKRILNKLKRYDRNSILLKDSSLLFVLDRHQRHVITVMPITWFT